MLGIGPWELAVIAIIALVLIGPRRLPEIMRSVGKGVFELRKASNEFRRSLEFEVTEEERDEQHARVMAERMKYMQQLEEEEPAGDDADGQADGAGAGSDDAASSAPAEAADAGPAEESPPAPEAAKPVKPS